jgi:signal peptide peptidase SppA
LKQKKNEASDRLLPRIAARVFNTPLLVLENTAATIASNLAARLGAIPLQPPSPKASAWGDDAGETEERKPYEIVDGVAVIPVRGELVNRGSWIDAYSGLTSYERLGALLRTAETDEAVRAIILDVDSPGGEAAGAMETAAVVRSVSSAKTIVAFVNACAASAAYAIAAGASEVVVTPSAIVGSIGVVWLHMDYSEAMKQAGVKPTLLKKGAFKTDGNRMEPLEPDAAARIDAMMDEYYTLFLDSVGAHRPALGVEGARSTEAGVYVGQSGVDAGLADRTGDLAGVIAALVEKTEPPRAAWRARTRAKSEESVEMAVKLYHAGETHADALIEAGKVDETASWSFSAEDGDKLLGENGDDWTNYARFHLGEDDAESEKTKGRFKYPYGKDGKVYRSGLIAAKQRAGQEGAKDIENAAGRLIDKIDQKSKKEAAMALVEVEAARAAGVAEGQSAERARIAAILKAPEAEGRHEAALALALETDLAPGPAVKVLVATAKAPAPEAPKGNRLDAIVERPNLSPDGGAAASMSEFERGRTMMAAVLGKKVA